MTPTFVFPAAACALLGLGAIGCAGSAASSTAAPAAQAAEPAPAQSAPLLADAVLVLPVHEVTLETGSGRVTIPTADTLRSLFDTELKRVLQPAVGAGWMWPDDLRALHRRNPLNVPDPTRLATRDLAGARFAAEQILSADLGSQLRALLAVAGARRYALLPLRLHAGPASHGGYAGGVTLLVIDTRRSMIAQVRPVALRNADASGPVPLPAIVQRLADLARLELTGAATQ